MDESVDIKSLFGFVSDDIFAFLSSEDQSSTSAPVSASYPAPTVARADHDLYPQNEPHLLEAEIDRLLLECSFQYETEGQSGSSFQLGEEKNKKTPGKRLFAAPKTEKEIAEAKDRAIPWKTMEDTNYCVGVWNQWCSHRATVNGDSIAPLEEISSAELARTMSNFVFGVRKRDDSEFPPDSIHHIVSGVQRFIRWKNNPAIDIFKDPEFADFRLCLDSEMKRLQQSGLGSKRRKTEPLSDAEEEELWRLGLLGDHSPQSLVDTIIVMNGIYFALRISIASSVHTNARLRSLRSSDSGLISIMWRTPLKTDLVV